MSNCVEIDTESVVFPKDVIDREALLKFIDEHKEHENMKEICTKCYGHAYWFLEGAIHTYRGGVVWTPGRGCRSTHTNRDLNSTIRTISKFVTSPAKFDLIYRDEFDGFKTSITKEFLLDPPGKEEDEVDSH